MNIHETIKSQVKDALRAKDTIRLDTLRGLNALFLNELLVSPSKDNLLPDDRVIAIIKRSAKQRKDSIEQFTKGGRHDLAKKERSELSILDSFLPSLMTPEQVKMIARERIDALKSQGQFDPNSSGKIIGLLMRELAGKAEGSDVKIAVEELLKSQK